MRARAGRTPRQLAGPALRGRRRTIRRLAAMGSPAQPDAVQAPRLARGRETVHKLLIAVVLATLTGAPAVASDEADVLATVHRWTEAFNHASFATDIAPCTEDAVVIDDLQPHVWQAPRACSRWYEAVKAWTVKAAVTKPAIAIGKPRHLDFEAGYAYLVAPV